MLSTPLGFNIDLTSLGPYIQDGLGSLTPIFMIPAALIVAITAYLCIMSYKVGDKRGELDSWDNMTRYSEKQERKAMSERTMPGYYKPGKPLYFQVISHYHKSKEGGI